MFKKTILVGCFSLFAGIATYAQFPAEGINYQAVARNAQGNVITSALTVRISIHAGSVGGTLQYQETHNTTPNALGLFNITIGQGTFVAGAVNNFNLINWGANSHFAKTEINTGSGFIDMGTSQLWAVPYALYAKNAGSGGGGSYTAGSGIGIAGNVISATDASATNEIQSLSLNGSALSISGGNTVNLPSGSTYTAGSGISIVGNVISATAGTTYTAGSGISIAGGVISATDNSATNEYQSLSLVGNTLTISNGNNVTLPTGTTYTAGTGISIVGTTISATDASTTNEIQTLSLVGNTLTISGGNNVTLPSSSGGGTLDQAYDFGGAGAGKTITADAGSVTINGSGTGVANIGLLVNHAGTTTAAIGANFSGTGNAIQAVSTNAANQFATIQASSNSSTANNSAIFGQATGAARAVVGQVDATATADVAVRGLNLRTAGGIGVEGVGFNGVSGSTSQAAGFAVFGANSSASATGGAGSLGVGTYGSGFNGIYGQTTNVTLGWAGYFTADVGCDGAGYAAGGWINASDRRLKSNIVPITGALDKVMMLSGKHYTITTKSPGIVGVDGKVGAPTTKSREQYGVIAQDLELIFPEMVKEKAIFINAGDDTQYKTVDYIQLVPVLIEAIKELKLEVEQLKTQIKE